MSKQLTKGTAPLTPAGFDQAALKPHPKNPRKISKKQLGDLAQYMEQLGDIGGITINRRTGNTVAGNQRSKKINPQKARMEWFIVHEQPDDTGTVAQGVVYLEPPGRDPIPFNLRLVDWDDETEELALVVANKAGGDWDWGVLKDFGKDTLMGYGFELAELELHGFGGKDGSWPGGQDKHPEDVRRLVDSFIVPPFSVLDARQGYWRERKKMWMGRIGDKGETRQGTLGDKESTSLMNAVNDGVSILDPVLSEALLHWFAVPGWAVCDCFAGDTVFGYVAAAKGLHFVGTELREEQATLNNERCSEKGLPGSARYICADGLKILDHIEPGTQDLFFSCPPYLDLEVYSDDPRDLSVMGQEAFFVAMRQACLNAYRLLREDRFACLVISEVRDKQGNFVNFVGSTIQAMRDAGFVYYNEAVLITQGGTLQIRAGRQMDSGRKLGRQHQNILVFYKGDTRRIKSIFPNLHTPEPEAQPQGAAKKKKGRKSKK